MLIKEMITFIIFSAAFLSELQFGLDSGYQKNFRSQI